MLEIFLLRIKYIDDKVGVLLVSRCKYGHLIELGQVVKALLQIGSLCDCVGDPVLKFDFEIVVA